MDGRRGQPLVRRRAPFDEITDTILHEVLDLLAGRYPSEEFAELRPRIVWDRALGVVRGRRGAQRLAVTSGGTIPDRGLYGVFLPDGTRVGELDEEMVYESRVGETFLLGASTWRIEDITHERVVVTPAPGPAREDAVLARRRSRPPARAGPGGGRDHPHPAGDAQGRGPRPAATVHHLDERAATNLLAYIDDQAAEGAVPDDRTIVVERFRDEIGDWRVCILSPFGARVHAPWAMVLQARLTERWGTPVELMWSDDGIVLRLPEAYDELPLDELLVDPEEVDDLIIAHLPSTALFASRFRECAARALLLPRRRPDRRTPLWQQRQKAADLLTVAARHPRFPILYETTREILTDVFDVPALRELLGDLRSRRVRVVAVDTPKASPFAQSLLFGWIAVYMYEGDAPLAERRAAALALDRDLLAELLGADELRDLLDADVLAEVEALAPAGRRPALRPRRRRAPRPGPHPRPPDPRRAGPSAPTPAASAAASGRRPAVAAGRVAASSGPSDGRPSDADVPRRRPRPAEPEWPAAPARRPRSPGEADAGRHPDRDEDAVRSTVETVGRRPGGRAPGHPGRRGRRGAGRARPRTPPASATPSAAPSPSGCPSAFTDPVDRPLLDLVARYARTHGPFLTREVAARYARRRAPGRRRPDGAGVRRPRSSWASSAPAASSASGATPRCCGASAAGRWPPCAARSSRSRPTPWPASCPAGRASACPAGASTGWSRRWPCSRARPSRPRCSRPTSCPPASSGTGRPTSTPSPRRATSCGSAPGPSASDDGRVRLVFRDELGLLVPEPDAGAAPRRSRPRRAAHPPGRGGRLVLARAPGRGGRRRARLRRPVAAGRAVGPGLGGRGHQRHARPAAGLRQQRHRQGPEGRRRPGPGGPAPAGSPARAHRRRPGAGRWSRRCASPCPTPSEAALARAQQLLERHGVLTREAALAEGVEGGFAGVYPVLRAMEDKGSVRRGYFVSGLGAAQFALPGAVDRLRAERDPAATRRKALARPPTRSCRRTRPRCPRLVTSNTLSQANKQLPTPPPPPPPPPPPAAAAPLTHTHTHPPAPPPAAAAAANIPHVPHQT